MIKIGIIKKRLVAYIAGVLAAAAVIACAIVAFKGVQANKEYAKFTVVIDAGHGGIDNGVSGVNTGVAESELNLAVAKLLKEDFLSAGFRVVLTRNTSAGLYGATHSSLKRTDMLNRKKIIDAASPDVVISIHMNNFPLASRRGAQVFYKDNDEQSGKLATLVQKGLNGLRDGEREFSSLSGDFYVLNVSPCPAVLVECGFLSNPQDEELLINEEYREKLSYTIFKGVIEYFTLEASYLG